MHELTVEEVIGCGIGICLIEAPPRFAFGVGSHDGDGEEGLEMLDVPNEVGTMGEGAEETCLLVSILTTNL